MISDREHGTLTMAVQSEIAALEQACDGLRTDSHLRTLCDVATEYLRVLLPGGQLPATGERHPSAARTAAAYHDCS